MGLNDTPMANRLHIAFFGKRNAGKSSLVNAVTNQNLAIISDVKGTTTDPVYKTMELLPLGPVVIIDTAGIDDEGELGKLRVAKTKQVLNKTDIAILVTESGRALDKDEKELLELIKAKEIPYIIAYNKADLEENTKELSENEILVSAKEKLNIEELKELIGKIKPQAKENPIVSDLIEKGDIIVLVCPIDAAAPKGRLILPQQQTIRDILDSGAISVVCKDTELAETLEKLKGKVKMVITDSQAFATVSKIVPEDIPLTSFSIIMARYKGFLDCAVEGVRAIMKLEDGDKVLISEGCTHHRQCEDIGSVKIPRLLKKTTGKNIEFVTSSGTEFPVDFKDYKLVIHCGGCMLSDREMKYRMKCAMDANVPFTNYGIAIAYMTGILKRSVKPLNIEL
ncbi:MAG: [FeFe] hydrogenase H-cluster maturation GTPase HydF [Clostridia bacterium]|nr:[FeFe] hydrogenase H-cluster maturation GTPase HydF [Clostridia bacterium]